MTDANRGQGWDKQVVNDIASRYYGGLEGLFTRHAWDAGDRNISQVAPTFVADAYGGVDGFEKAHANGLDGNPMLDPWNAIDSDPPHVWLTSGYGFDPDQWGFIGFSGEKDRRSFLERSVPGTLVVIYATGRAPRDMRGNVVGLLQVSHRTGDAQEFMTPEAWAIKQADPEQRDKWNLGVRAIRAWKVTRETWMPVKQFAPNTYTPGRGRVIGKRGMMLDASEARRIRELDLFEWPVASGPWFDPGLPGPAEAILSPSRAGPVSKRPFSSREAEGPKHLYILKLNGDAGAFMGKDVGTRLIVKVGMSRSPDTRCQSFNATLPECAFQWTVYKTTAANGGQPFPSSKPALDGEEAMKNALNTPGVSWPGVFSD